MHLGSTFYEQHELEDFGFCKLGKNVKIKRNACIYFTENVSLGDNVRIDDCSILVASREPVNIGSFVHIANHCCIAGSEGFEMEDFSGLSPGVMIFTGSDDYSGGKLTNPTVAKAYIGGRAGKVILRRHVIIGAGTVILPRVTIETGSSVGSMSLVNRSLPEWSVCFGTPARVLKRRKKDLLDLEKQFLAEQANS